MNFERCDILRPILDDLGANDQILFYGLQQKVLGEKVKLGMEHSPSTVVAVFEGFREQLTERAKKIFSEFQRVIAGTYVEDFDNLTAALKAEWTGRLESMASVASPEFMTSTACIRSGIDRQSLPSLPGPTALSEHIEKLKPKWFAEIELFCVQLHDSQVPRLFLKAGEVFAGNRVARAIFAAAKQSLDITDTYFGAQVFDMLEVTPASVRIRLISNRADNPTRQAYALFNQQFNNRAEFRLCDPNTDRLHDRFIIVDGARALHLGGSIKDLGTSDSLIDAAELDPHKRRFEELWLKARSVV
jgi:hypothetical protein